MIVADNPDEFKREANMADVLTERLAPNHLDMLLRESGISADVVAARGYRTVTDPSELEALGFTRAQRRAPGLLIPLHGTDGTIPLYVYRPDNPRVIEEKRKGKLSDGTYPNKVIKYEQPKGSAARVDCPPMCRPALGDPSVPLWITEGQKKADSLASRGLCAIALLGVWSWKGRNQWGGKTVLPDLDYIAWNGRDVRIVFDSDVMRKPEVQQALSRLTEILQRRGARVNSVFLPPAEGGRKVGVDDWLAAGHTVEELEALVEGPRPQPKAAAPTVELLDEPPLSMRRPLALLEGKAYAATWLHVRVTESETVDEKTGMIRRHDPPLVRTERRLFVVGDDGRIYGDGGDAPLDEFVADVVLPEIPPADKIMSARAVRSYKAGQRPDPVDVFNRVVDVVDRFIDFDRSLGDQRTMAEMIGAYIVATYFLDAFNVVGFLWSNGDRGSGKTQLLLVITELAYLGQLILAGGSYATLRDLADYGATLAFDDAENVADPKQTDPDKRALLLAGNRRGATVTVKEPDGNKAWRTRYVNSFCPRLFSAIRIPDQVLASRTIVVPLIRTDKREKANADPLAYELWPHDRRQLIDDLWAVGLCHLPEMKWHERIVSERARLTGRNLEPWRGILAVASWLDEKDGQGQLRRETAMEKGADPAPTGLWDRLEALSWAYQEERPDLERADLATLTIRALCHCATSATSATKGEWPTTFEFTSKEIATAARAVATEDSEDDGAGADWITTDRVGRQLGKMRLDKAPRPGGKGSRRWRVSLSDLERWTTTYGLKLPNELAEILSTSGTSGTSGPSGTGPAPASDNGTAPREVFEL